MQIVLMTVMFTTFFRNSCSLPENNTKTIIPVDLYFGLKQPGLTPEIFSPEISFFKEQKVGIVFYSPDGKTFFFQTIDSFYYMKSIDGHWTNPTALNIIGTDGQVSSPNISPDGSYLLYTYKGDILTCKWQGDSLSMPEKLPEQINSE
jgi:WD40 repeat protein